MADKIKGMKRLSFQIAAVAFVVMFMANLSALIDHFHHPEIPYFDYEHLIIGGITALMIVLLSVGVILYMRRLENAVEELKNQRKQYKKRETRHSCILISPGLSL